MFGHRRIGAATALIALLATSACAKETLLTFDLPAGAEHCYYEDVCRMRIALRTYEC